ncbi:hypothetical protein VTI74DRAFT_11035 [Chaetomium olivicolor]
MPPSSGTTTAASAPGSASAPRTLAKFGCVRCREHHLKCDRVTPTCGRCLNAGKPCTPPGLKIRVTTEKKFKFAGKQKWVKTPRRLVFIDESKTVIHDASSPDSGPDEFEAVWESSPVISDLFSHQDSPVPAGAPAFRPGSPTDRLMISSAVLDPDPPAPKWPLVNREEAHLFQHFVQKLARWLDLCDPQRTFEVIVPQLARDSPILLYAIFALSARHLGQTRSDVNLKDKYNELANGYNAACLNLMKGLLDTTQYHSGFTEHLFAATIILQVMEEMNAARALRVDAHNHDADRGHLPGMYRFVESQSLEPGTLGAASFWVGLRQEIYSAVTKRQPVCLNLDHPDLVDRLLSPADDDTWANRAVVHCADVLNFCFDVDRPRWRWDELDAWNRLWLEKQPRSYDPVFKQDRRMAVFPEIWYHRSCQVIGVQHHLLARLFLLGHRIGPGTPVTAQERREIEDGIREAVREVCGIGRGNQWTPPGMFTACMAISAFGAYFQRVEDQDAMLAILEQTQQDHARPTEGVIENMLKAWGRLTLLTERQAQKEREKLMAVHR